MLTETISFWKSRDTVNSRWKVRDREKWKRDRREYADLSEKGPAANLSAPDTPTTKTMKSIERSDAYGLANFSLGPASGHVSKFSLFIARLERVE